MKFGIVADDNTGATDAAGMLTERGVRTALFIGAPDAEAFRRLARPFDAAVLGVCSRSIAPRAARERTAAAVERLVALRVEKVQIKYCSTFDSTPEGNIGPSLDAAMDALRTDATIVSPALPVNGRTTYCGYHFVKGQLLSESPLKDHPLNPMRDANLVRWLQRQTRRTVALAPLAVIRQGVAALERFLRDRIRQGASYLVTDTIDQSDLTAIARATAAWPLISGGSGITAEIPPLLFPNREPLCFSDRLARVSRRTLVIAGSCSPATAAQNARALRHGFDDIPLDGGDVLEGRADADALADRACRSLAEGRNVILRASAPPDEVARVQAKGQCLGLSAGEVGERIAECLAVAAARTLAQSEVGRLLVSGGETSAAVCRASRLTALEAGLPIEPGVPYCFPMDGAERMVVLKSGNFGSDDFYLRVRDL